MSNYLHGGYEKKYIIQKTDGKPIDPKADYFVLRLDKDPHALVALKAYKASVRKDNPQLSSDLHGVWYRNICIQDEDRKIHVGKVNE